MNKNVVVRSYTFLVGITEQHEAYLELRLQIVDDPRLSTEEKLELLDFTHDLGRGLWGGEL